MTVAGTPLDARTVVAIAATFATATAVLLAGLPPPAIASPGTDVWFGPFEAEGRSAESTLKGGVDFNGTIRWDLTDSSVEVPGPNGTAVRAFLLEARQGDEAMTYLVDASGLEVFAVRGEGVGDRVVYEYPDSDWASSETWVPFALMKLAGHRLTDEPQELIFHGYPLRFRAVGEDRIEARLPLTMSGSDAGGGALVYTFHLDDGFAIPRKVVRRDFDGTTYGDPRTTWRLDELVPSAVGGFEGDPGLSHWTQPVAPLRAAERYPAGMDGVPFPLSQAIDWAREGSGDPTGGADRVDRWLDDHPDAALAGAAYRQHPVTTAADAYRQLDWDVVLTDADGSLRFTIEWYNPGNAGTVAPLYDVAEVETGEPLLEEPRRAFEIAPFDWAYETCAESRGSALSVTFTRSRWSTDLIVAGRPQTGQVLYACDRPNGGDPDPVWDAATGLAVRRSGTAG